MAQTFGFGTPMLRRLTKMYTDTKSSLDFVLKPAVDEDDELRKLHRKLRIQKDRLTTWGFRWSEGGDRRPETAGSSIPPPAYDDIDESLSRAGLADVVGSIMGTIKDILAEAEPLWKASGVRNVTYTTRAMEKGAEAKVPSMRWDKGRFEDLVKDLTSSIDTLYDISRMRTGESPKPKSKKKIELVVRPEKTFEKSRMDTPQLIDVGKLRDASGTSIVSVNEDGTDNLKIECGKQILFLENDNGLSLHDLRNYPVLVEFATYDSLYALTGIGPPMTRFEKIFNALQREEDSQEKADFGSLKLVGYFEDNSNSRFGMIYELPQRLKPVKAASEKIHLPAPYYARLADILSHRSLEPALEVKFRLAYNLATSVFDLHSRGVVHGNLALSNITLFEDHAAHSQNLGNDWLAGVDLRRPYLTSYDLFPEPATTHVYSLKEPADITWYRHKLDPRLTPASPFTTESQLLDLYSLAILLLEIGLWQSSREMQHGITTNSIVMNVKEDPNSVYKLLAARCGTSYQNAFKACFEAADSKIAAAGENDSERSDVHLQKLYGRVLSSLEKCCSIEESNDGEDFGEQDTETEPGKHGAAILSFTQCTPEPRQKSKEVSFDPPSSRYLQTPQDLIGHEAADPSFTEEEAERTRKELTRADHNREPCEATMRTNITPSSMRGASRSDTEYEDSLFYGTDWKSNPTTVSRRTKGSRSQAYASGPAESESEDDIQGSPSNIATLPTSGVRPIASGIPTSDELAALCSDLDLDDQAARVAAPYKHTQARSQTSTPPIDIDGPRKLQRRRGDTRPEVIASEDVLIDGPRKLRRRVTGEPKTNKEKLSKALQKANSAVVLDNQRIIEGALVAYQGACTLLQEVIDDASENSDKRKLEDIHKTYKTRITELEELLPTDDDIKDLPTRRTRVQFQEPPSPGPWKSLSKHASASQDVDKVVTISSAFLRGVLRKPKVNCLVLDLRIPPLYARSRIRGALNICVPASVLADPLVEVSHLAATCKNAEERARLLRWQDYEYIFVYDTQHKEEDPSTLNTIKKFIDAGWTGKAGILMGGFESFAQLDDDLIDRHLPHTMKENDDSADAESNASGKALIQSVEEIDRAIERARKHLDDLYSLADEKQPDDDEIQRVDAELSSLRRQRRIAVMHLSKNQIWKEDQTSTAVASRKIPISETCASQIGQSLNKIQNAANDLERKFELWAKKEGTRSAVSGAFESVKYELDSICSVISKEQIDITTVERVSMTLRGMLEETFNQKDNQVMVKDRLPELSNVLATLLHDLEDAKDKLLRRYYSERSSSSKGRVLEAEEGQKGRPPPPPISRKPLPRATTIGRTFSAPAQSYDSVSTNAMKAFKSELITRKPVANEAETIDPPNAPEQEGSDNEGDNEADPAQKPRRFPAMQIMQEHLDAWHNYLMPEINNALRKFYRKHQESVEISLETIGESPQKAKPTILVICTSVGKVKGVLKRHFTYDATTYGLMVCRGKIVRSAGRRRKPRRSNLHGGDSCWEAKNTHHQERPLNGASIGAYCENQALPPVSFGGMVMVDGEPFGMSVHHMLDVPSDEEEFDDDSSMPTIRSTENDSWSFQAPMVSNDSEDGPELSDFDSETESNYSSDAESVISEPDMELGDIDGIAPEDCEEGYLITQPAFDDIADDFFRTTEDMEEYLDQFTVGKLHASSGLKRRRLGSGLPHEIDWALFKFSEERMPSGNHIMGASRYCSAAAEYPASCVPFRDLAGLKVHAIGRTTGLTSGFILPAVASVRIKGRETPSQSYMISGGLGVPGDSGAWVMENHEGRACGHVLAWSDRKRVAYFSPMEVMLEDIKEVLDADTVCFPQSGERAEDVAEEEDYIAVDATVDSAIDSTLDSSLADIASTLSLNRSARTPLSQPEKRETKRAMAQQAGKGSRRDSFTDLDIVGGMKGMCLSGGPMLQSS